MDISVRFVKGLGFKKIDEYYSRKVDVDKIKLRSYLFDTEKVSAFSIATTWSSTFGVTTLSRIDKFVPWYKLYYPMVGMIRNSIDQTRVLKASQKMRLDYLEIVGRDLDELLTYTPRLELTLIRDNKELTSQEVILCEFINTLYAWGIMCYNLQKSNTRENFESLLEMTSRDFEEFEKCITEEF